MPESKVYAVSVGGTEYLVGVADAAEERTLVALYGDRRDLIAAYFAGVPPALALATYAGADLLAFARSAGWCHDPEAERDDLIDAMLAVAFYRNRERGLPPKHRHYVRKPNRETRALWHDILGVFDRFARMTVRQLYYQLVNLGHEKTEEFYKRVDDATIQLRLCGLLGYDRFLDGSRQRRQILQYSSLGEALERTRLHYRQDLWANQARRIEVWCEKDALTGLFLPICQEYGVPFVAVRGFSSMTLVYESAAEAKASDKPTVVYYFGDHDPSGRAMSGNYAEDFRLHDADVEIVRVALNPDQVARYALPTRPTKTSDSRAAKFAEASGEGSVELDALPPDVLTDLVRDTIEAEIDPDQWAATLREEALAKEGLAQIEANLSAFLAPDDG